MNTTDGTKCFRVCLGKPISAAQTNSCRDGPYFILDHISPASYKVVAVEQPTKSIEKYHTSALQPFIEKNDQPNPTLHIPIRQRGRSQKHAKATDDISRIQAPKPRPDVPEITTPKTATHSLHEQSLL